MVSRSSAGRGAGYAGRNLGRRSGRILGVLGLVVVLCAACSGASSSKSATTASASAVLTMTPSASGPFTDAFNPFLPTVDPTTGETVSLIYEPLLYPDYLQGKDIPWLAKAWSFSDGGRKLTLTLRKGVEWSNGRPFTARDVAFTFDLLRKFPALNKGALPIVSATATSTHTVVLEFSLPVYADLDAIGSVDPVPMSLWSHVANPVTYRDTHPVGTGPYELVSYTPQVITLKRNPHYWQSGLAKVPTIRAVALDSPASIQAALETGKTDWTGNVFPDSAEIVKADSQLRVETIPYVTVPLLLNFTKYPLQLLPVREAISDALNRAQLVKDGLSGYGDTEITTPTGLLPSMASAIAPEYRSLGFTFSDTEARHLLEQAGFHLGSNGIFVSPKGTPLVLDLLIPGTFANWLSLSQYMGPALKKAGIGLKVSTLTVPAWRSALRLGNFDVSLMNQTFLTPYGFYKFYMNGADTKPVGKLAFEDYGRFKSAKANAALANFAEVAPDSAQAERDLATLEGIEVHQLAFIPLFVNSQMATFNAARFSGWPTSTHPYAVPTPYANVEDVVLHLRPKA